MNTPANNASPSASTPEGCIAAIPRQSVESCELVILNLAARLSRTAELLDSAIENHVHGKHITAAEYDNCVYLAGCQAATQLLSNLYRDWPRLFGK